MRYKLNLMCIPLHVAQDKLREKILGTDQAGKSSLSPTGTREMKVSTATTTGAGEGSTESDRTQEHSDR